MNQVWMPGRSKVIFLYSQSIKETSPNREVSFIGNVLYHCPHNFLYQICGITGILKRSDVNFLPTTLMIKLFYFFDMKKSSC